MDRRERVFDPEELFRTIVNSILSRLWTAMPCQIVAFYPATLTADCQPTINGQFVGSNGEPVTVQMPVLPHVPVEFPGGGGATLTWTPQPGDECTVIFMARNIDSWVMKGFQSPSGQTNSLGLPYNSANTPKEFRRHNLSDGICFPGVRNQTRLAAPAWSLVTGGTQLQSDDGQAYVQLNPTTHAVSVVAPGGMTLNGVTIDSSGNITSPSGTQIKTADGHTLTAHVHGGVQTGGGNTGTPTG